MKVLTKILDNGSGKATILVFLIGNLSAGIWFASNFYTTQQQQAEKITQIENRVQDLGNIKRDIAVNDQRLKNIEASLNEIKSQLSSIQSRMNQ